MRKFLFTLMAIACFMPVFSQTELSVTFCGNTEKVTPQAKIVECGELNTSNDAWKVKSFTISFKNNDGVVEMNVSGHIVPQKMLTLIKENSPNQITVDNIQLISQDHQIVTIKSMIISIKK